MWRWVCLTLCVGAPVWAEDASVDLPRAAMETGARTWDLNIYELPTGHYADGALPTVSVEGQMTQKAWQIPGTSLTLVQVLEPLKAALKAQGFDLRLDCVAEECGGYDFRFAIRVLSAPAMFVDIFRYRFVSALQPDGRALSILATRVGKDIYVQITQVTPEGTTGVRVNALGRHPKARPSGGISAAKPQAPAEALSMTEGSLADALVNDGHVVLEDLAFKSGSDSLQEGSYASLEALAEFTKGNPAWRVMLVGHTDAVGSLQANIALSKRRAASVVQRLVKRYKVPADQLSAQGMGYLAPRATNLTEAGRALNRRVDAVLLNTKP